MTPPPVELLTVNLDVGSRRKVGRLAIRNRQILFEYDPQFLASGIEISPFRLPLKPGVHVCPDQVFDGLHGVFNDSLPDGWGRLLLDRTVEKDGMNRRLLSSLDRLAWVGCQGMGALSYEPELGGGECDQLPLSLEKLAGEAAIMLSGDSETVFEELLQLNGSSSGARPKIVAQVSDDMARIFHGQLKLQAGFSHWIVKFQSGNDPRDIGAIEYAYSLMARDAGVEMPETHLFRTRKQAWFGAKRFDRCGDRRVHMHSLSGLLHADHRTPALDYDTLLRVALVLTKNIINVEKAYALACFNVLAHNRDDHPKNFSFLLTERNEWVLSPAYDLTCSTGPGGEQSTMLLGEGRNPGIPHLIELGRKHGLKTAPDILARVQAAITRWPQHADQAGISRKSASSVEKHHAR
ncbi:MAG: type II toxin-antitoxin system HipA family toxin [Acidobacteriia bacterium]|nr:type II toxin-antitoxin system HipA family toxin [Terriglobia bacterium]